MRMRLLKKFPKMIFSDKKCIKTAGSGVKAYTISYITHKWLLKTLSDSINEGDAVAHWQSWAHATTVATIYI